MNALIALAGKYPFELSSLPYLYMIEMRAFAIGDDAARRWVRSRMNAIESVKAMATR